MMSTINHNRSNAEMGSHFNETLGRESPLVAQHEIEATSRRFARGFLARSASAGRKLVGLIPSLTLSAFHYEKSAVRAGRRLFAQSINRGAGESCRYQLRRDLHRIEKGLISRPLRKSFAKKYIVECVDLATHLSLQNDKHDRDLLAYARDTLTAYFEVVELAGEIAKAKQKFDLIVFARRDGDAVSAPTQRSVDPLKIDIDGLTELAIRRRSVRWFADEPVDRDVIDRAIKVAGYSPSACNRQPFVFRIYDDPDLVREVSQLPMGTDGFAHNFPCICVVTGQLRAFPHPRDRHVIYIDASLAAMSFQFALEVQGISSCCINWPEIPRREKAMIELLKLEKDERPIMLMALGRALPEQAVPFSQKKPVSSLRTYNQIGSYCA